MGEKLVTSLFILTATAMIVRNGNSVSTIISSISSGARAVISTLLVQSSPGGGTGIQIGT